jgi:hypothetical protein
LVARYTAVIEYSKCVAVTARAGDLFTVGVFLASFAVLDSAVETGVAFQVVGIGAVLATDGVVSWDGVVAKVAVGYLCCAGGAGGG